MECASVRFASRCGRGRWIRPHHRATLCKRCTMMRSNRPSAAAVARESHARALHARNNFCCTHGVRKRAIYGGAFGCCSGAA
eukprot:7775228-Lingulodinium_polyedra.AAC.1